MNKKEAKKILNETLGNHIDKGDELLFTCPSCTHHKRKFSINLDKHVYKCWVCDYRGRNIRRVVRRFGTYLQLQKWDAISNQSDLEKILLTSLWKKSLAKTRKKWNSQRNSQGPLRRLPAGLQYTYALRYLQKRSITKADILKWKNRLLF